MSKRAFFIAIDQLAILKLKILIMKSIQKPQSPTLKKGPLIKNSKLHSEQTNLDSVILKCSSHQRPDFSLEVGHGFL